LVAAGDDFGNLYALIKLGVWELPSTMEKLALARACVHAITVKVIANSLTTCHRQLIGHAICIAQQPTNLLHQSFGEATLAAAFYNLRVLFVDPLARAFGAPDPRPPPRRARALQRTRARARAARRRSAADDRADADARR
jgi:hypothetical protein